MAAFFFFIQFMRWPEIRLNDQPPGQ